MYEKGNPLENKKNSIMSTEKPMANPKNGPRISPENITMASKNESLKNAVVILSTFRITPMLDRIAARAMVLTYKDDFDIIKDLRILK
jgi:hypothetical protein